MWGPHKIWVRSVQLFWRLLDTNKHTDHQNIYIDTWFCVCLYATNVKTAEPIGPTFIVGPHLTPGYVYGWKKFQKLPFNKILFRNMLKSKNFFHKIRELFMLFLTMYTRRKCSIVYIEARNTDLSLGKLANDWGVLQDTETNERRETNCRNLRPHFLEKKKLSIIFLIAWMIHEQQQENGNPEKIKMSNTCSWCIQFMEFVKI